MKTRENLCLPSELIKPTSYYNKQFWVINDKHWMFLLGSLAVFLSLSIAAALEVLNYSSVVTDTGVHELQLSPAFTVLSPSFEDASIVKCPSVYPSSNFLSLFLFLSPACSLPSLRGLSDLLVNLCGYSELCLCYWKHPSNTPISHDVKMIGCALFGYPFPIAGHDWREQPEMMGFLCDTAKKGKKR